MLSWKINFQSKDRINGLYNLSFLGSESNRYSLNFGGRTIGMLRGSEMPGIAIFGTSTVAVVSDDDSDLDNEFQEPLVDPNYADSDYDGK